MKNPEAIAQLEAIKAQLTEEEKAQLDELAESKEVVPTDEQSKEESKMKKIRTWVGDHKTTLGVAILAGVGGFILGKKQAEKAAVEDVDILEGDFSEIENPFDDVQTTEEAGE